MHSSPKANNAENRSPQRVQQPYMHDTAVFSLHIQSNQKMISNLEHEFNKLRKIQKNLFKNHDLEFILPKKIQEMQDQITFEKSKGIDMLKQSRIYDKEITRLMTLQEQGHANKNSLILRDYLQTKEIIDDTEKLLDKREDTRNVFSDKIK